VHDAPARRSVTSDLLRGALGGAVVAGLCLGVGLVRGLFVLVLRHHVNRLGAEDLRTTEHYVGGYVLAVGGFVVAGASLGVAKPLLQTRTGTYVRFALGGGGVAVAIAIGDKGSITGLQWHDWVVAAVIGALLGYGVARSWLGGGKSSPHDPPTRHVT
jgi:hypothetical protein